ncbi:MAG: ATP-binding protein [Gemmatimonadaceae bacterium]
MNLGELDGALRKLRLSGMAATLDARLRQAQSEKSTPIDLVSALVADELIRREDRLITRRIQQARFRDVARSLDTFDLDFNKKMNRALIHDLATGRFIQQREDVLFLGPPGTGKSHLARAIGRAAILQGHRVLYREAHQLLEDLADATLDGTRKAFFAELTTVPLLIIDDLGMRKLRTQQPKTSSRSSCAATSGPPRCSLQIGLSTTGGSCWGTPPPSPHSWIGYSTTRTS